MVIAVLQDIVLKEDVMFTKLMRKILTRHSYGNGHCVPDKPDKPVGHCY